MLAKGKTLLRRFLETRYTRQKHADSYPQVFGTSDKFLRHMENIMFRVSRLSVTLRVGTALAVLWSGVRTVSYAQPIVQEHVSVPVDLQTGKADLQFKP